MPHNVILLVEDNADDVFLIQRAFTRAELGSELHPVENADEAIDYLTARGKYRDRGRYPLPVMMLLDLKLPGRSGLEVLQWLRQQEGLRRLPVIVLTNSSEAGDINSAFDAGANSYLVKNPDPDGFLDITRTVHLYWTTLNQRPNLVA